MYFYRAKNQTEIKENMFKLREMLTSALRALVKNLIKESFYGKKKKTINVLTAFFISHKSDIKTFLK